MVDSPPFNFVTPLSMSFMNRKHKRYVASILAVAVVLALITTPTLGNLWSLVSDRHVFFIPQESSIFTFYVTEMNDGSGEWWVSGEDFRYFYARIDEDGILYAAFPRSKVSQCPSFQLRRWTTWCEQFRILHKSTET
ncbi:MAG: hypothetical protein F6K28_34450 [Microcoleus sp. SIO2G3]|nr:hypothetical protein [Microcoleus sp. SIO2G3]